MKTSYNQLSKSCFHSSQYLPAGNVNRGRKRKDLINIIKNPCKFLFLSIGRGTIHLLRRDYLEQLGISFILQCFPVHQEDSRIIFMSADAAGTRLQVTALPTSEIMAWKLCPVKSSVLWLGNFSGDIPNQNIIN